MNNLVTSDAGKNFIANFEGIRLTKYKDAVGIWTIGIGHVILPGENYTTITHDQAMAIFTNDLRKFERPINGLVTQPLNQIEFDALVSLSFNIGVGNFTKSSVLRFINEGQTTAAGKAFLMWNHAGGRVLAGLTRRRQAESKLFLTGQYS